VPSAVDSASGQRAVAEYEPLPTLEEHRCYGGSRVSLSS